MDLSVKLGRVKRSEVTSRFRDTLSDVARRTK